VVSCSMPLSLEMLSTANARVFASILLTGLLCVLVTKKQSEAANQCSSILAK
jgi:hypothetical protein